MQFVRLYVDASGTIEHVETSDHPLPTVPAIEAREPITPGDSVGPTKKRVHDYVTCELEPNDGKFKRAREVMDSLTVRKSDLRPSLKSAGRVKGRLSNIVSKRADRAE